MKIDELISRFNSDILKHRDCVILPHLNADGDSLGSSIALNNYLKFKGINSIIIVEEKIPEKYDYLNRDDVFELYDGGDIPGDFIIALDTGDFKRLGKRGQALSNDIEWNLDHHKTNTSFAVNNYIDQYASSTGEIIYKIIKNSDFPIDKNTAEAVFTAISTDTGGLRYSNTTPDSMRICADLLETGIDISEISHRAFDMMPYPKLMLKCLAIQKMKFFCNRKIGIITLGKSEYEFLEGKDEYFDGIVNITVNTEGVLAGALIRETDNGIKVNLRSNTDGIDVSLIAGSFNGGGHHRAAGCTVENLNLEETIKIIIKKLCGAV